MPARNKPESATDQPFKRNLALIIGIDDYQNGYPRLETAVNDAQAVANLLARPPHHYQVTTLIDGQATTTGLKNTLDKTTPGSWASQIGPEDRVLFYFAGHGIKAQSEEGQGPAGFLLLQNADFATTGKGRLGMVQLQAWLTDLPCRHLLVVLDCCFAGAMRWSTPGMRDIPPEVIHKERYDHYVEYPAWQLITSAGDDEKAMDIVRQGMETPPAEIESIPEEKIPEVLRQIRERSTDDNHSPFAKALIEALRDGAGDIYPPGQPGQPAGDGLITASELIIYLENRVSQVAREAKHRQVPKLHPLAKHSSGEFVFFNPNREMQLKPAPDLDINNNPYRTDALTEADAELFYGRESEVRELLEAVLKEPLTLVTGASGVGKSSLVRAGLLPRFVGYKPPKRPGETENDEPSVDPDQWQILPTFIPADKPTETLLNLLQTKLSEDASTDPPSDLPALLAGWANANPQRKLLLVVDQLERVLPQLTAPELILPPEVGPFFDQLRMLIDFEQCHLVLILREDYKSKIEQLLEIQTVHTYEVAPMGGERVFALQKALERPAWARVLYYDPPELVTDVVVELNRGSGALALLAQFGSRMYLEFIGRGSQSRAITETDYQKAGSVTDFICKRATDIYNSLKQDQDKQATMRRVVLRLMDIEGGELNRRRIPRSELNYVDDGENERVTEILKHLTKAQLLVWSTLDGKPHLELSHGALVQDWKLAKQWRRAEKDEKILLQRRVTKDAREWDAAQKRGSKADLWHNNVRLPQVEEVLEGEKYSERSQLRRVKDYLFSRTLQPVREFWLNALELHFVQQSVDKQRWQRFITAYITLAVIATLSLTTFFALIQQNIAETQRVAAVISEANAEERRITAVTAEANAEERRIEAERQVRIAKAGQLALQSQFGIDNEENDVSLPLMLAHQAVMTTWQTDTEIITKPFVTIEADAGLNRAIDIAPPWIMTFPQPRHGSQILGIAFSLDGQTIASAGFDQTIRLWSVKTGKQIHRFDGHTAAVQSVTFSPDGEMMASTAWWPDNTIRLWNVNTGEEIRRFEGHSDTVNSAVFNPDGRVLASASDDQTVRLWDVGTGLEVRQLEEHTTRVNAIAFSPDGQNIATADDSKNENFVQSVRLWEIATGREIRRFDGPRGTVEAIQFNSDGQSLLTAGQDHQACLWTVMTGEQIRCFEGHTASISTVVFSPDESMIATGSNGFGDPSDTTVRLWDTETGQEVNRFEHSSRVWSIAFSPDGNTLAAASSDFVGAGEGPERTIRLWNVQTGQEKRFLDGHIGPVVSADFGPDGRTTVSVGADQAVRLWEIDTGREIRRYTGHTDVIFDVSYNRDGNTFVTASNDGTARLWDVKTGQEIERFEGHTDAVLAVTYSPDGQLVATGGADQSVRLWNVNTGQETNRLTGHTEFVWSINFSSDGEKLVTSGCDQIIRLWEVSTGQQIRTFEGHSGCVLSADFGPDGRTIVSVGADQAVRLWEIDTGREIRRYTGHTDVIFDVSYNRDGNTFVTASNDGTARLWDVKTGQEIERFEGHTDAVLSSSFSPDGRTVITSSRDGTVRLWKSHSIRNQRYLEGHTKSVTSVAFGPNSQIIATASSDGTARLWDATTGQEIRRFEGHKGQINSVEFNQDGQILLTGSDDFTSRLWDVKTGHEIRRFEASNDLGFTIRSSEPQIWATFAPDGLMAASTNWDGTVRLWDTFTGQEVRQFQANSTGELSIDFSPNGDMIASGGEGDTVNIWNVETGQMIRQLLGHTDDVSVVEFSPDGQSIISTGVDRSVRIWSIADGQEIGRLRGHTARVLDVVVSPDGKTIVTTSADNIVRVWDFETGQEVRRLTGHTDSVNAAVFSPDGQVIVTASSDRTAQQWFSIEVMLDTATSLIQREPPIFSGDERRRFGLLER